MNSLKNIDFKNIFKKALLIVLAGILIGTGVGIILFANIGGDTITVFQDGLHNVFSISYGQASRLYNVVLILIAILFARKYFGFGTIISALITGYAIDFVYELMIKICTMNGFISALIIFMIGQTIYTIGLSILIRCNLGMNSLDSLIYRIIDFIHIDYKIVRFIADLLLTVIGYLLGGVVGIGTIISILLTGIMIDIFVKIGEKKSVSKI